MTDYIKIKNQDYSYYGIGSRLKGEIHLKGITHFASKFEGNIQVEDDADLYIEKDGSINGTINCNNIEIYGNIIGKLTAKGIVTIYPTGKLSGTVDSKNLIVYPGAILNIEGNTNSL